MRLDSYSKVQPISDPPAGFHYLNVTPETLCMDYNQQNQGLCCWPVVYYVPSSTEFILPILSIQQFSCSKASKDTSNLSIQRWYFPSVGRDKANVASYGLHPWHPEKIWELSLGLSLQQGKPG